MMKKCLWKKKLRKRRNIAKFVRLDMRKKMFSITLLDKRRISLKTRAKRIGPNLRRKINIRAMKKLPVQDQVNRRMGPQMKFMTLKTKNLWKHSEISHNLLLLMNIS